MKKLTLVLFIISSLVLFSCNKGNSSKEVSENIENTGTENYSSEYLNVDLGKDWPEYEKDGYAVFSFEVDSSGNIYNDFNQDLEQIGDVTETTVDGMPAITRLQKFMQNELLLSRVWLIYDGKNMFSFNVSAPEKIFDDKVAKSIVSKVVILNKGKNVTLPVEEENKYKKPDIYPVAIMDTLQEVLSSDALLSVENVNNSIKALTAMQNIKDADNLSQENLKEMSDKIYTSCGFTDIEDLVNTTLKPATFSATIFTMIKNSEPDNSGIAAILKGILSQNNISSADLKFTYEHWDLIMKLIAVSENKAN